MPKNYHQTNPECVGTKHGSYRAYTAGCRCDDAIVSNEQRRQIERAYRAKDPKPVEDDEPDYVLVAMVAAGQRRWTDSEVLEADRVAIVAELASRGKTVSWMSDFLGASRDRIARLLGAEQNTAAA